MLLSILFSASVAAAATSQALLPKPSGVYQVGRSVAEVIDHSRTQPFAPVVEPRKLMISVFYPVSGNQAPTMGAYMPPETARFEDLYLSSMGLHTPNGTLEPTLLQLASSKAVHGPNNGGACAHPLVLFMPAEGTTRLFYNLIASTISSMGYTVVTIDTPFDVDIVQYTDGSFAFLNQTVWDSTNVTALGAAADVDVQTRAQDASFVLDTLANTTFAHSLIPNLPGPGLNTTHVAMFGHSIGGAATLTALTTEPRLLGGLDMDGDVFGPAVKSGTSKPFMILAHANNTLVNPADPTHSWALVWPHLTGFRRFALLNDALHYDFSDIPIVLETLGVTPSKQAALVNQLGTIKAARALQIVTTYVGAFLDFVVYGKCSALLDGPVAAFPEISFEG